MTYPRDKSRPAKIAALALVAGALLWMARTIQTESTLCAGSLSPYEIEIKTSGHFSSRIRSLVYLPDGYPLQSNKKQWPLVLFLHGSQQRGRDLNQLRETGLPYLIEKGRDFPFVMIAPQCGEEESWDTDKLLGLLAEVQGTFDIDSDRIHVTGFEMGGFATWDLAAQSPDTLATAVPFGGFPTVAEKRAPPAWISRVHLWSLDSPVERLSSKPLINANYYGHDVWEVAWKAGDGVRRTHVDTSSGSTYGSWTKSYEAAGIIRWMLQKRRKGRYFLRWPDEEPDVGKHVWGELWRRKPGASDAYLLGFWLYIPTNYVWDLNPGDNPSILFLHGSEHLSGDRQRVRQALFAKAIDAGKQVPFIVVSPQCPDNGKWASLPLVELLDQLDVSYVMNPRHQSLVGIDEGASAIWDLAATDPPRFASMVAIGFTDSPLRRQQSHQLYRIPKWLSAKDAQSESEIAYYNTVAKVVLPFEEQPLPHWTFDARDSIDCDAICEWLQKQPANEWNNRRDWWPTNVPNLPLMASPKVVERFEHHEDPVRLSKSPSDLLKYRLYVPADLQSGKAYPLVVWLHGHGAAELDLEAGELKYMDYIFRDQSNPETYKCFVLAMQCPRDHAWIESSNDRTLQADDPAAALMDLITHIQKSRPIDPRRIALVGISSGGTACWELLKRHPGFFSRVAPLSGGGTEFYGISDLAGERVWVFNSLLDPAGIEASRVAASDARRLGADVQVTEIPSISHFCWAEAFFDYNLLEWLVKD